MAQPKKHRLLTILQILAIPLFLASGFATISSLNVQPRRSAAERVKEPIPVEWEWVVVNHDHVYPWPYHGRAAILFPLVMLGTFVFLIVSGLYASDWQVDKLHFWPRRKGST